MIPRALRRGDRIALVSTSWGSAPELPERFDRAITALADLGYVPVVMPNARGGSDGRRHWVSGSVDERLADLHAAFGDPSIAAVLSVIGGDHSAQLVEALDFDLIASNPKIFCGYSDTTTLLHAIHTMTGLVTFYGPALIPEFGEPEGPDREVIEHWQRITGSTKPSGPLPRIPWQSAESRQESDRAGRNMRRRQPEQRVSVREGVASGPILAGCLPSILRLAGTRWWPETAGRILVVECPEEPYDVELADADFTQLRNMGVFDGVAGLAIGRTDNWSSGNLAALHEVALDACRGTTFPILAGVEITHSAPLLTIPIGVRGSINGLDLSIDEAAVH